MIHRAVVTTDLDSIKNVLDSCGLFPSEYLEDMISPYLSEPESEEMWFTTEMNSEIVSVGFCAPEKLTNGTYNLYAIGVHASSQGKGVGRSMLQYIEDQILEQGGRVLIIETSSTPDQEIARKLYLSAGYHHEATLRDFWDEGDDKIIFLKKLI